jgi:Flp pilus assembly protein TadB
MVMKSPGTNDSRPDRPDTGTVRKQLPPLHWSVRLIVLVLGCLLVVVGIAGLVLPGIQGILTIVLGLAVISLASDFVHRQLRRLLTRWPKAHQAMERFRERLHGWLSR